nr:bifunctional diguanylate cyclase/phosphodiesterase [Natronocella acetinitrilica]
MEEGVFGAIDGGPVTIAWYHANLHDSGDGGAAVVSVGLDVTARKGAEQHLGWLASHDTLTGLYNRRQLQAGLEAALARDEGGAVIHFDLDSFRDVNDSSGHHAGDELLRLIASTLEREFSERGVLARMGGDEFALLVEGADESQAVDCAERITRTLDELVFVDQGRRHRIQASIGIVCFPRHGETCQELLANADLAMYRAKEAGKSWHVLLDESGSEAKAAVRQRVYWSDALREALREDRLELHAQPIMHLESGRIGHFEVLVRLRDQTGVLHPPSSFIPVAERSGQISQIDLHVLAAALREIGDEGRRSAPVSLAVNLSAQTLRDDDFVAELAERLRESGADPARLTLEITETVAVTDFAATRRVMEAVSALGCQFALDDFGVGFSSFHYLAQLPAALIKIDGSFIRGLAASRERQAIVSAISAIAQGFDKRTVAEFVETEADAAVLRAMGIDYAQGDFVGKPLPIAEALSMDELSLRRRPPRPRNALP